jgi:hypothetical protein
MQTERLRGGLLSLCVNYSTRIPQLNLRPASVLGVRAERRSHRPALSAVEGNEQFQGLLWRLARRCAVSPDSALCTEAEGR